MADMPDGQDPKTEPALASSTAWDVRETRIRLPGKVVHELKRIADATGITMNALIAAYIDAGLKAGGRPCIDDLAPWFTDYLRRKGGRGSRGDRPGGDDDDFT
ncbi:hypothetical protein [Devosia sp. A449]